MDQTKRAAKKEYYQQYYRKNKVQVYCDICDCYVIKGFVENHNYSLKHQAILKQLEPIKYIIDAKQITCKICDCQLSKYSVNMHTNTLKHRYNMRQQTGN